MSALADHDSKHDIKRNGGARGKCTGNAQETLEIAKRLDGAWGVAGMWWVAMQNRQAESHGMQEFPRASRPTPALYPI